MPDSQKSMLRGLEGNDQSVLEDEAPKLEEYLQMGSVHVIFSGLYVQ
jgi:hypothetical protein